MIRWQYPLSYQVILLWLELWQLPISYSLMLWSHLMQDTILVYQLNFSIDMLFFTGVNILIT